MPHKIIVSFLLSALLFAGIGILAYTGYLDAIESRFYSPAVTEALIRETTRDAKILSDHIAMLQNHFFSLLYNPAVRRSFLPEQDANDIYERSMLFGLLQMSVTGLQSVRFIDSDGIRMLFSTYPPDIVRSDSISIKYRNYDDDPVSLSFSDILVKEQEQAKLILDKTGGRIIFSFPFYDSLDIYRGMALFDVSIRTLTEGLVVAGRASTAEPLTLYVIPEGIVSGVPGISSEKILSSISDIWTNGYRSIVPFISADVTLALIAVRMEQGFYYGRIVNEAVFVLSPPVKILTLMAIFLTIFLTIFFLFNLKQGRPVMRHRDDSPVIGQSTVAVHVPEALEELEAVEDPASHGKGLLAVTMLKAAESATSVIHEQNGIPYVNSNAFNVDKNIEEKLDKKFVKLVESVVNET
jgi:hypothetical protein